LHQRLIWSDLHLAGAVVGAGDRIHVLLLFFGSLNISSG
jgi:hypothetical protein